MGKSSKRVAHIAIGGPIGAGKTTLANMLGTRFGGRVIAEVVEENPFIQRFYTDAKQYALLTQLAFLLSRARQQMEIARLRQKGLVVTDYVVEKDGIFAMINLQPTELEVYKLLRHFILLEGVDPDVVIYLRADPKFLAGRIGRRGRSYERKIKPDYLGKVSQEYEQTFSRYNRAPVMVQDASEISLARLDELADRLREFCGKLGMTLSEG